MENLFPRESRHAESWLMPLPFLAGIVASFVFCCAAGWITSEQNVYDSLERFPDSINPTTLYYPTASQIRAFGRSQLDPKKVTVVIGGNSVMQGCGQGQQIWTRRLQALLGPDYQVFNFGMSRAYSGEFGAIAAEIMERDFPRIIFVTNLSPGPVRDSGPLDGQPPYQYFFWDAYCKGLLVETDAREEKLAWLVHERRKDEAFLELRRQAKLDQHLRHQDLWTSLAYTHVSTVWHRGLGGGWGFLKPRRAYLDPGMNHYPVETRFEPAQNGPRMKGLQGLIRERRHAEEVARTRVDAKHRNLEEWTDPNFEEIFQLWFPEPFRKRTLLVLSHSNPYYVDQLDSADRAYYARLAPTTQRILGRLGFPTLEALQDRTAADYVDLIHLSEEGGTKLADDVAPKVRELALRLGYLTKGVAP